MRKIWIFLIVIPIALSGQVNTDIAITDESDENAYLTNYSDQLTLKLFGVLKSNRIRHYDNWTKRFVDYKPNENFNIGIGLGHKWLNLDLAFSFPFVNNDDVLFGKTKRFDIQANIYLNRLIIDFNLQSYKGYYGSNPGDYIPDFDRLNPVYPLRPDISTFNTAISVLYNFKPEKFSYRAAFVYNERQMRSAGSWLTGTYLGIFEMNADSSIVPVQERSDFNPEAEFRGTRYLNTGLSGGYGHTFVVKKKFFLSMTLVLGLGPTIKKFPEQVGRPVNTETEFAVRGIARTAFGYNSKRFFIGISSVSSGSSEVDEEVSYLSWQINNLKIFFGYRIHPPGFVKKI